METVRNHHPKKRSYLQVHGARTDQGTNRKATANNGEVQKALIAVGVIYKITYPNGKIYIGQDRTDDPNYFGSCNKDLLRREFDQETVTSMTIRKDILVRVKGITIQELNRLEREAIIRYDSHNPLIGYNRNRWVK